MHYEEKLNTAERDAEMIRSILLTDTPAQPATEEELQTDGETEKN
jgi:hypothetical protein